MAYHDKEYKQLSCRDFGAECDFMARAETEEEVMKYGYEAQLLRPQQMRDFVRDL